MKALLCKTFYTLKFFVTNKDFNHSSIKTLITPPPQLRLCPFFFYLHFIAKLGPFLINMKMLVICEPYLYIHMRPYKFLIYFSLFIIRFLDLSASLSPSLCLEAEVPMTRHNTVMMYSSSDV